MVSMKCMNQSRGQQAAASRDPYLTLRRVERQQYLIERLSVSRDRLTQRSLADDLGVTERTIARDIERLIHSGVPITVLPGRRGGARIESVAPFGPIELDLPEIAAIMASLAAVGPSVSESATSAMNKLAIVLGPSARRP